MRPCWRIQAMNTSWLTSAASWALPVMRRQVANTMSAWARMRSSGEEDMIDSTIMSSAVVPLCGDFYPFVEQPVTPRPS